MEQTYFESGKIVSNSLRLFLGASIVLIIFLLDNNKSVLLVPFISIKMSYKYALGSMLFLQACFFYRFIAAVNYERELRLRVKKKYDNSIEETWALSYPSIFNFHQFSGSLIKINNPKSFKMILAILLIIFGLFLPAWAVVQNLLLGFDYKLLLLNAISCILILLTMTGLINPRDPKDNNTGNKAAKKTRASS